MSDKEAGGLDGAETVVEETPETTEGEAPTKKRRTGASEWRGNPVNSWGAEIPGLKDALKEAFESSGIPIEDDFEDLFLKIQGVCQKQAKKYYNDTRTKEKMNAAQARSYVCELVESIMGSLSSQLYDKSWFTQIAWNASLVYVVYYTFTDRYACFTRIMKTDIGGFIDDGLLAWSEEERIQKAAWSALEAGGIAEGSKKRANQHLLKSYDDAHYNSPFGSTAGTSTETANVQEFVKGWMEIFCGKAHGVLENGLQDSSPAGQVAALTNMWQAMLDPNNPCLPVSLQPHLPATTPWPYIETCAAEIMASWGSK